jgi:hypothetical protein
MVDSFTLSNGEIHSFSAPVQVDPERSPEMYYVSRLNMISRVFLSFSEIRES